MDLNFAQNSKSLESKKSDQNRSFNYYTVNEIKVKVKNMIRNGNRNWQMELQYYQNITIPTISTIMYYMPIKKIWNRMDW